MQQETSDKKGIYLVANQKSETFCENLIYSIRASGCTLPIRVIPFGGQAVASTYILKEAELYPLTSFPQLGLNFVAELRTVLVDCPMGFLYRFLAWFGDWDTFIYSDNDVVALMNWEYVLDFTNTHDFVHADEEYITEGKYNYDNPEEIELIFGQDALLSAFTAGHFAARKNEQFIADMKQAVQWYTKNPGIAKKHDQALMHIASLLGNWKIKNLCRHPHNWLSTWAGNYTNTLQVVHKIQHSNIYKPISHLHYSGHTPSGTKPIEDFLYANADERKRTAQLFVRGARDLSGYTYLQLLRKKVTIRIKKLMN